MREPSRPGLERNPDEPQLEDNLDLRTLPFPIRAELRGLTATMAETVGGHLLMAGQLMDEDPELAYQHADSAKRRAARLPVVREALAETSYAAGHFEVALNEMRALRRMTGSQEYLAAMADCERALGRPQNSLKLAKEATGLPLDAHQRVEMAMVEAGARDDLGQDAEAKRLLKRAIEDLGPKAGKESLARLQFAYGDLLSKHDDNDGVDWVMRAITLDPALDPAGDTGDDYEVAMDVLDESPTADGSDDESGQNGES